MRTRFSLAALCAALLALAPSSLAQSPRSVSEAHALGLPASQRTHAPSASALVRSAGSLTTYRDRSACEAAGSDLGTEDFEDANVADGTTEVVPSPADANSDNAAFDPGDIVPGLVIEAVGPNSADPAALSVFNDLSGLGTTVVGANFFDDATQVSFPDGTDIVCLDYEGYNGFRRVDIQVFDTMGGLLGSFDRRSTRDRSFFGVASPGLPVGAVRFLDAGTDDGPETTFVDDVTFGSAGAPPAAAVDLTVTAFTETPVRGGFFDVFATAENTGDTEADVRVTIRIEGPGGEVRTSEERRQTLRAGALVGPERVARVSVPEEAPAGTYTVTLFVVEQATGYVLDTESFEVGLPSPSTAFHKATPTDLTTAAPEAGPNPFSTATTIHYALLDDVSVDLRVYDVTGREVATLVSGSQAAGVYAAVFEAGDLPGGVYVWRLAIGGEVTTGRVTLAR